MKSKTGLMRKADRLFSEHWRKKIGKCEHCARRNIKLDLAHIITRDCRKLRYERKNCVVLCSGCHFYFHKHPLNFAEWVKKHKGPEAYKFLLRESNKLQPLGRDFYEAVIHSLTLDKS
jgi:5-methylcytosine-specific restriction endonuclease McrA